MQLDLCTCHECTKAYISLSRAFFQWETTFKRHAYALISRINVFPKTKNICPLTYTRVDDIFTPRLRCLLHVHSSIWPRFTLTNLWGQLAIQTPDLKIFKTSRILKIYTQPQSITTHMVFPENKLGKFLYLILQLL